MFHSISIVTTFWKISQCRLALRVSKFHIIKIEGFHDASSDASQQSTGAELYPERRQGKLLIIAVVPIRLVSGCTNRTDRENIWNMLG